MTRMHLLYVSLVAAFTVQALPAQTLTVRRADGTEQRVSAAQLAALPRTTVEVLEHNIPTTFEGVTLASVLRAASAGPVDSLRGAVLRRAVLLVGEDGYAAVVALAEVDASIGGRNVLLADRVNGAPLASGQGPWRAVVLGDGRAARWVRALVRIEVVELPVS